VSASCLLTYGLLASGRNLWGTGRGAATRCRTPPAEPLAPPDRIPQATWVTARPPLPASPLTRREVPRAHGAHKAHGPGQGPPWQWPQRPRRPGTHGERRASAGTRSRRAALPKKVPGGGRGRRLGGARRDGRVPDAMRRAGPVRGWQLGAGPVPSGNQSLCEKMWLQPGSWAQTLTLRVPGGAQWPWWIQGVTSRCHCWFGVFEGSALAVN
jgi:hypothetical protein